MAEPIRVLHVDDEPDFADMAAESLEREDDRLNIDTATSAAEGAAQLEDEAYDCIISDFDMPGQNGIEFLESIREVYPDVPFILFTGKGSEEIASAAISAGVTDYLQKETGSTQYAVLANRIVNAVDKYRSQLEFEETNEILEAVIDASPVGILSYDRDGYIQLWNPAAEEIYGWSAVEVTGEPLPMIPDGKEDEVEAIYDRVFEGESFTNLELERETKSGEMIDISLSTAPLQNREGEVIGNVSVVQDITDRKERERELQRYETIIEALGDPVYALNEDGRYTFVNEAYADQTEYDRDDIIGAHVSDIVSEVELHRGQEHFRRLLKDDERRSATWEVDRVTADGDRIPCEHHMALLPSDDGKGQGTAGVVRDISDRKEREERLAEMTDRMQLALKGSRSWIWDWNLKTDITTQSAVFGVEEETVTRPIEDFIQQLHPDDREDFRTAKEAAVAGEQEYHAEYRLNVGDELRWIEARGQVYQGGPGDPPRMIGIATDVTEQKEQERTLERYRHLVNSIDDPVATYDEEGRYDLVNEALAERYDTTPADLRGRRSQLIEDVREMEEGDPYQELLDGHREEIRTEFPSPTLGSGTIMEYRFTRLEIDGTCEGAAVVSRDVTESKERERRIEALHESTQLLLAAESEVEVAELIAEAVTETLDYPCSVVRLLRDEDRLVPLAITDEMEDGVGNDRPSYDIGEGTAGRAFEMGETVVYEDVVDLDDGVDRGGVRGAMYLPIGDYGVVTIADREPSPFDQSDINLSEILMANVEGVLERIERERELREQKERLEAFGRKYELVAEASADAFWDWDPVTDEITRSEGYLSQFGYDRSEVVAETDWWRNRIHPDDRERVLSGLQEAVEDPDVTYDETYRFERKDGTYGFLRSRGHVVYDDDGEPTRMIGAHIDLTEREQRERSITDLHSATRAMLGTETKTEVAELAVETARDVVGLPLTSLQLYDEDANVLRPVAATAEVTELFGTVPEIEPGGSLIWRAYSSGEVEVHDDVRDDPDVMNPDTPVRSQVILPLGEHGVLICTSTEVGDFGQVDVMLARLLAENTRAAMDRIDQEQTLRERTSQIERTNERLEAFASVVSHDLRNPLNVAHGRLHMAQQETDIEYLDAVEDALERMDALINDLLTLAKEGQTVEELDRIDLASAAKQAWQTVETDDAELVTETARTIRADPTRLQQLLENLFRNAIEHGGDDVTVTVGDLSGGFSIADTGPGIPVAEKERVFESGYTTNDDGTGLGLAIVKEVADAHGWEITLTDSDHGGAEFEITGVTSERQ